MDNLKQCYEGKTVVISAHRLSTIKDADQIIVLHHGEVVEQGTHMQLLEARGHYLRLVENQMDINNKEKNVFVKPNEQ